MMLKYFFVQCKRLLRCFPGALLVAVALMLCLLGAYNALTAEPTGEDETYVTVAFTGETDNMFLQMGISAVSNLDSTRLAMQVVQMEEDAARKALESGEIAVYIVFPEGFMDAAMVGELMPLQFVSTANSSSLTTVFKTEITQVVSTILVNAQKGVFAYSDVLGDNGLYEGRGLKMDIMALEYVEKILVRDRVYTLQELGFADGMPLEDYLLCGLTILLFMLICLPFGPVLINGDHTLGRVLKGRGLGPIAQVAAEFLCYGLLMTAVMLSLVHLAAPRLGFPHFSQWLPIVFPIILTVITFSFMIYSCADHIIGGMLTYFFSALSICFVSGCMYPVFFFPVTLQKLAAWLPTGLARIRLSTCLTANPIDNTGRYLLGYSVLFLAISIFVRQRRIKGVAQQ